MLLVVGLSGCGEETNKTANPIIINNFGVSPTYIELGETANLTWDITGATTVSIDNDIGTVGLTGTRIIQPTQNTTYTLTASNSTASITATTKIIVNEATVETQTVTVSMVQTANYISIQKVWSEIPVPIAFCTITVANSLDENENNADPFIHDNDGDTYLSGGDTIIITTTYLSGNTPYTITLLYNNDLIGTAKFTPTS